MARPSSLVGACALAVPFVMICAAEPASADEPPIPCQVVEVTVPPHTVGARVCPPVVTR